MESWQKGVELQSVVASGSYGMDTYS